MHSTPVPEDTSPADQSAMCRSVTQTPPDLPASALMSWCESRSADGAVPSGVGAFRASPPRQQLGQTISAPGGPNSSFQPVHCNRRGSHATNTPITPATELSSASLVLSSAPLFYTSIFRVSVALCFRALPFHYYVFCCSCLYSRLISHLMIDVSGAVSQCPRLLVAALF